jgi:hypothetical protein
LLRITCVALHVVSSCIKLHPLASSCMLDVVLWPWPGSTARELDLRDNLLWGPIGEGVLGNMTRLSVLDLSDNLFTSFGAQGTLDALVYVVYELGLVLHAFTGIANCMHQPAPSKSRLPTSFPYLLQVTQPVLQHPGRQPAGPGHHKLPAHHRTSCGEDTVRGHHPWRHVTSDWPSVRSIVAPRARRGRGVTTSQCLQCQCYLSVRIMNHDRSPLPMDHRRRSSHDDGPAPTVRSPPTVY